MLTRLLAALLVGLALSFGSTQAQTVTPKVEYNFSTYYVANGVTYQYSQFSVGNTFDLVLKVRDLRPNGTWYGTKLVNGQSITQNWPLIRGVYAAYADLGFPASSVRLVSTTYNAYYPNGIQVEENNGLLNDTGAFAQGMSGDTAYHELMRFRFICTGPVDTFTFSPTFNNLERPKCDTLVYGNDAASPPEASYVDATEIQIVPATISIRP